MPAITSFRSRAEVFDYLDEYAFTRKEEVNRRELGQGLIKSYVLETFPNHDGAHVSPDLPAVLKGMSWQVKPIEANELYAVRDEKGDLGFIEAISARHLVLHSYEVTQRVDQAVQKDVRNTALLDSLWLAGNTFSSLWETLIYPHLPDRFVTIKFEHLGRFEESGEDIETGDDEIADWSAEEVIEQRASTLAITERARQLGELLPHLQEYHPAFKAIKMLRFPASATPGGYEFWSWGKVTYRAPSFRDGREQVLSITRLYEQATLAIENLIWFQIERHTPPNGDGITLQGAPVTLQFSQPLQLSTFRNFITVTFERNQGPLRLWGNPIWLSEKKVHVYGIDMHLWQRVYFEITPRRIVAILPRGTCGNTVHRLMTNVQRYLDPAVQMFIGDIRYSDLIHDILLGKVGV